MTGADYIKSGIGGIAERIITALAGNEGVGADSCGFFYLIPARTAQNRYPRDFSGSAVSHFGGIQRRLHRMCKGSEAAFVRIPYPQHTGNFNTGKPEFCRERVVYAGRIGIETGMKAHHRNIVFDGSYYPFVTYTFERSDYQRMMGYYCVEAVFGGVSYG